MEFPFFPLVSLSQAGEYVLLAGYAAIALAVTGDALLRKREVRAALGWIGVAWLSPVLGGLLYYLFGINRVTRRALRLPRHADGHETGARAPDRQAFSPNIAALERASERVTCAPLADGNKITLLDGGREAFPAMLDAIAGARESVALASYIFRDDRVGRQFIEALAAAKARGLAVRVLLDGVGSGYVFSGPIRRLKRAGVPVARFLHTWIPWRMPFLNMRSHKKLLIVDGRLGFTGGINIGAEYDPGPADRHGVRDVHARIEGPVVARLMESFAQDWTFTTEEMLDDALWWPEIAPAGSVCARGAASGPDGDINKVEEILGAALAQARIRVRIVSPYFLPDQRLEFAIAQARLRGVDVQILLPERCDYRLLDWAMRAHLRFFAEMPDGVFFSPRPFDHAKLMTVDGEWCLIGSSNWDARSLRLNFEFDLECYGHELAGQIDRLIDARLAAARAATRAELMGAPRWMQLRDAAVRLFLPYL